MKTTLKDAATRAKHCLKVAAKEADKDTPVALALVKEALLLLEGMQAVKSERK